MKANRRVQMGMKIVAVLANKYRRLYPYILNKAPIKNIGRNMAKQKIHILQSKTKNSSKMDHSSKNNNNSKTDHSAVLIQKNKN